jgi:hypothetical protein
MEIIIRSHGFPNPCAIKTGDDDGEFLQQAAKYKLSGGSMVNII